MVTTEHEILIDLARQAKPLVPELIHQIGGLELPSYVEVRDESESCGESVPIERRADAVQTLRDRRGRPVLSVVFEVQRSYKDEKWASWLSYTSTAINQYDCPTVLVVLCPKETEAKGYRRSYDFGFGTIQLRPIVVSFSDIPVIDDADEAARHLGLAMLSAMAHGHHGDGMVLDALSVAFNTLAVDAATTYSDLMFTALSGVAWRYWRDLMSTRTYAYQNDYARELEAAAEARGEARGEARMLLKVLGSRGIEVRQEAWDRITNCRDRAQLERWAERVATVATVDELFEEPPAR